MCYVKPKKLISKAGY